MALLKDRLWIWGHPPGSLGAPNDACLMTPMEGALYLNARNVYYVPMFRKVDMTRLNRAMDTLNNVGWSMEYVYSNPEVMENLLAQANQFPNVTRGVLDDFFNEENEVNNVTNYSPEFLASMRERMHTGASHPLEMWMVFYTKQFEKDVAPYINEFDGISLWFWNESETRQFDDRCERFFELTPNKKRAIGIYLYSFGDKAEADADLVEYQLNKCLEYLHEGKIQEIILHTNGCADHGFAAVERCKAWTALHGNDIIPD